MTRRERMILEMIANGLNAKEMASEARMTYCSMHSTIWRMLEKYDCRNRAHLVSYGFKNGYLI
jgi:DNA-binding NarL/FixJ family response regulator